MKIRTEIQPCRERTLTEDFQANASGIVPSLAGWLVNHFMICPASFSIVRSLLWPCAWEQGRQGVCMCVWLYLRSPSLHRKSIGSNQASLLVMYAQAVLTAEDRGPIPHWGMIGYLECVRLVTEIHRREGGMGLSFVKLCLFNFVSYSLGYISSLGIGFWTG